MRRVFFLCFTACWGSPAPVAPQSEPKELVQPVSIEKQEDGDPNGVEGGEEGGVLGVPDGDVSKLPPPPPPPPGPIPQNVAPTLLEAFRVSGDKNIVPEDATKTAIAQSGKTKIVGSWKLCVSDQGAISNVVQLKSTGFPDYDTKIQQGMRMWRYKPYLINGQAVPVCTAVTFLYSQSAPTP